MVTNSKHVVYLDNAATTPLDPLVLAAMSESMISTFGNPSASHSLGRQAKGVLENSRSTIAKLIGASPREIIFTSGGTEADNIAIRCSVRDLGVRVIITSPIEHKAVLETAKCMIESDNIRIELVRVDELGRPDYVHLAELAAHNNGALISLMHANNEIGTLIDPKRVSQIAKDNNCLFHSDTVQTMGHYPINVEEFGADFLACSAHKFHGPKGIGFLYIKKQHLIKPIITGGGQERNLRAGTENIPCIVGLTKALELCYENAEHEIAQIQALKSYFYKQLESNIPNIEINGDSTPEGSLYTVLSVLLPEAADPSLAIFQLDLEGICCSGGSACNSGAQTGSYVLNALGKPNNRQAVRFSFSRFTKKEDLDAACAAVQKICNVHMEA
ncbi:MAG: cysteine desulfurase [Bacteroidia bacterium]|jgi:cysteine desulfurase